MGNKLAPGCCCGSCFLFGLGVNAAKEVITNQSQLQSQLDSLSQEGHDVILLAPEDDHNFRLPASGTWSSSQLVGTVGFHLWMREFFGAPGTVEPDHDVILRIGLAPASSAGFGTDAIILTVDYDYSADETTYTLESDWTDSGYALGQGEFTITRPGPGMRTDLMRFLAMLDDSVETDRATEAEGDWGTTGLIAGSLHRPIATNVQRRIHIENLGTEPWDFDGFCVYDIRDDRSPNRPAPGNCEQYFAQHRGLQKNEPVAIKGRVYTFDQDPQAISLRKPSFSLTANQGQITDLPGAICHAPIEPLGYAPSPVDLGSATGFQTVNCAGFRAIMVASLRFGVTGTEAQWTGSDPPYHPERSSMTAYAYLATAVWVPVWNDVSGLFEYQELITWPSTLSSQVYGPATMDSWDRGEMPKVLLRHSSWSGTVGADEVVLRNNAFFAQTIAERLSHTFERASSSDPWTLAFINDTPMGEAEMDLEQAFPGT